MAAPAFTKFDPRAFRENAARESVPAKAAKAAKAPEPGCTTLATLAALAGEPAARNIEPSRDTWTDAEEERAAIVEYEGDVPRAWAEGFAQLDPSKPPANVPAKRWLRFIDDCGRFLDGRWPAKAAHFGWGPLDLFGCDRERPFARIDHLGLLWLLGGGAIIELHRDRAIIKTASGTRQSHQRRPVEVGRVVLAWELADAKNSKPRAINHGSAPET